MEKAGHNYAARQSKRAISDVPDKIVRLIYFDEAGTASEQQEPILIVAAVMIDADRDWLHIERDAQQIIDELVPEKDRPDFHFHAKDLFGTGTYDWGKEKRWEVLRVFLSLFENYDLPIPWGGIDRASVRKQLPAGYKPDQILTVQQGIAFLICAAVTESWFSKRAPNEVGMCIGERAVSAIQTNIQTLFKAGRAKELVKSFAPSQFRHLIDAVSFRTKTETIGVQLADACNFFIKRYEMGLDGAGGFYQQIARGILGRGTVVRL